MRHPIILLSLLFASHGLFAQQVLHFTRTSGWDHQTRGVSYTMFQSIATELGVTVDDDATGDAFSDPANLAQYAVIVFSNTSGDAILNEQQRTNFEAWVANGGHVMGIHAASDTYRHSTANGNNTGTWDFYPELIGASVQENPNHVAGTPTYTMQVQGAHPSIYNVPNPWEKAEEYYYWEGGYFAEFNSEVLIVEETVGPNGQVNSYDAPRPMSWYRFLPQSNTKVFYTALGHAPENFTTDTVFRAHIRDALGWLLEGTTGMTTIGDSPGLQVYPNPATDVLTVVVDAAHVGMPIQVLDATGRVVLQATITGERTVLPVSRSATGNYVVRVGGMARAIQVTR
jgi:type 1 glutamine amidotransferase